MKRLRHHQTIKWFHHQENVHSSEGSSDIEKEVIDETEVVNDETEIDETEVQEEDENSAIKQVRNITLELSTQGRQKQFMRFT